ncbi:DUF7882 family protein [Schumannella soli]|uniref:DUF7882 family protein n=1 Tax=Schumannella soli TaxID=2590779 RepID=UPI00210657C5|nr:ATP-dependent DNA ligase [Schumannella soli]
MGRFLYGAPPLTVEFEDRVLAHLRTVMVAKLRRNESFLFTWEYSAGAGSGHTSVWLHPSIPLRFEFYGAREPQINPRWVDLLSQHATSASGLQLLPEPRGGGRTIERIKVTTPAAAPFERRDAAGLS